MIEQALAPAAAVKSSQPGSSRSSAPGMHKANVFSSPLFFCVTEFPRSGGDRWLVYRPTAAAAQSEGPGLPATPLSLPRYPPQLQVQQLRGERVSLLGPQHGLQHAVEQGEPAATLLHQPHPLQG